MDYCFRSLTRVSISTIVLAILLSSFSFTCTCMNLLYIQALEVSLMGGCIGLLFMQAVVTMYNFQQYRNISSPGWTLGWTWAKKEVIWSMVGSQTTEQGDCSRYKGAIPHCCMKTPTVVDLLPGTPYNQQIANCCKGGVISSWAQDPNNYASSFQVSVGVAGTTNRTVKLPKNFTLLAPGPGYTCGPTFVGKSTKFITPDGRRVTQAMSKYTVSF
uniref:COBRA-like protein n=1 Tax=Lactuca sativa TaxID=4236 RepID=A0A9R1XV98_LACSA|nr:hypothetical protein LSAT_V11C200082140 [Lactuca sativa]